MNQPACIFCRILRGEEPSWKIAENEQAYAFLDIHPVNPYHTLVIPKNHYDDIFSAPEEELLAVMRLLKQVIALYHEHLGICHVQIVNSSGAEAQQDVFHLHFHIVPRHHGDGNSIRWQTHPELRAQFDELLTKLPI